MASHLLILVAVILSLVSLSLIQLFSCVSRRSAGSTIVPVLELWSVCWFIFIYLFGLARLGFFFYW
ncbi:hypothetical protein EDB83DRAFT_120863 [Lactarius deliciosus]|nr:hypothetical protein EDB83DRAFT_120863 [Lactarius deliciosus]